jgi:hypothetical protein
MEVADWLDRAVQRTKEKYQVQRDREETVIQLEALKRRLGSNFCRQLFAWLESIEARFNRSVGCQMITVAVAGNERNRSAQVLARPILALERLAELYYHENTDYLVLSIAFEGGAETTQMIKLVLASGTALAEIGMKRYRPEELGQKIIEDLLA